MYVAVRHKPEEHVVFWFAVPEPLVPYVKVGEKVVCNTKKGKRKGEIVSVLDGVSEDEASLIIGPYFPLKEIMAVESEININEITLDPQVALSKPSPEKLKARIVEYYKFGEFRTKVVVDSDGLLLDGFTAFLVCNMFDLKRLKAFVIH